MPINTPIAKNQCNLYFSGCVRWAIFKCESEQNEIKKQRWKQYYTCSSSCVFNATRRSYSPLLALNLFITAWCFRYSKLWGELGQAATFHLFVLMRKILLIRHVLAGALLRICVSLCIHLVHSMWEVHNLAACVVSHLHLLSFAFFFWFTELWGGRWVWCLSAIRRC